MKHTTARHVLFPLAALLLTLTFAACTVQNPPPPPQNTTEETAEAPVPVEAEADQAPVEADQAPVEAEGTPAEENAAEDIETAYFNRFTGLPTTKELSEARPAAIMINNIRNALPQQGIINADVVYEVLAEGGITRLLCLFTDYASLPETGSIRSSRDYFIDLAEANDAVYVHCGGSPAAYDTLAARGTDHIDGIYDAVTFWRDPERMRTMGTEHSMMTDGKRLTDAMARYGFRTTSNVTPFAFADGDTPFGGDAATYAAVRYSAYCTAEFEYLDGVYQKKQFGEPHIDANTGETLAFKNLLLLNVPQGLVPGDDKGRLHVDFVGEGTGYYISGGAARKIVWKRADRRAVYTLYEADGAAVLKMNPGKTYVGLAPTTAEITIW